MVNLRIRAEPSVSRRAPPVGEGEEGSRRAPPVAQIPTCLCKWKIRTTAKREGRRGAPYLRRQSGIGD
ncbi:unnamed protein product [Linum trigynum]|uniref:Uncharacterized protein n=1 Tax=Linum trigynum TaxID=586398 RepID=A0AAV2DAL0_9ROSI